MQSLSDDLMMTVNWTATPRIAYMPKEKLLNVWVSTVLYSYSLATKAWVGIFSGQNAPSTTVQYLDNIPFWLESTTLKRLDIANGTATSANIETGKISCGDLSRNKKFKKVYITCKEGATNTDNCYQVEWSIDGATYNDVTKFTVDNGINTFIINQAGKTIQFRITAIGTTDAGQEISDIALIYRDKTLK